MKLCNHCSLKPHHTFGIDVKAAMFAEVYTREEILGVLKDYLPTLPQPLLLIGGGSNLLFTKDFPGTVLKISTKGISINDGSDDHVRVSAEAGEPWDQLVNFCVDHQWYGLENLSAIPGQVGSSPIQNIGAYGVEMKDCFECLEALDRETLEVKTFYADACKFGYRSSIFKGEWKNKYLILSVTFKLSKKPFFNVAYGDIRKTLDANGISEPSLRDIANVVTQIRRSKLPDPEQIGNAGSFFKNPVISAFEYYRLKSEFPEVVGYNQNDGHFKLAAAWLIEQCGWKGTRRGDAGVHPHQALILVNYGKATGSEIVALSDDIRTSVRKKFGVELFPEINIIS